MAQFGFENDVHSILKLDMPITNAPMARWQRKASSSNTSSVSGLSPGKSANVSLSSSKTPSKTPGTLFCVYATLRLKEVQWCVQMLTSVAYFPFFFFFLLIGKNKKQTPSKTGADRFIPTRNSKQMDVANFLLTKENEPVDTNNAAGTSVSYTDTYKPL